jgi:hypothetical protein
MSQVGDKGTLEYRLDLFDKCQAKELTVDGDINPCTLKGADLKKCASKLGISPMLLPDEILAELITILEASGSKKQKKDDEGSSSSSSATEKSGGGEHKLFFNEITSTCDFINKIYNFYQVGVLTGYQSPKRFLN